MVGPYDSINLGDEAPKEGKDPKKAAMDDMARYLGALYRVDSGKTIEAIEYNGKTYKWKIGEKELKGSNWRENGEATGQTLVNKIVLDFRNGKHTVGNPLKLTLVGTNKTEVSVSLNFKQEFPVEANGKGYATLQEAIDANGTVKLLKDVTISDVLNITSTETEFIDLNGKTLSSNYTKDKKKSVIYLKDGKSLTIKNGNLDFKADVSTRACIGVEAKSSITLDNVNYTTDGSGIMVIGDAASVNVMNGTEINALGYCVSTNASTTANNGVVINLENSKFNATCTDKNFAVGTPILLNVECTSFKMNGCEVNGIYQGVIIRSSKATIENTIIRNKVSKLPYNKDYEDSQGDWRSGNEIPRGALIVGNRHKDSYPNPTEVILKGCTIEEQTEGYPAIFVWGNKENQKATLICENNKLEKGELVKGNNLCEITPGNLTVVDKTQTPTTK